MWDTDTETVRLIAFLEIVLRIFPSLQFFRKNVLIQNTIGHCSYWLQYRYKDLVDKEFLELFSSRPLRIIYIEGLIDASLRDTIEACRTLCLVFCQATQLQQLATCKNVIACDSSELRTENLNPKLAQCLEWLKQSGLLPPANDLLGGHSWDDYRFEPFVRTPVELSYRPELQATQFLLAQKQRRGVDAPKTPDTTDIVLASLQQYREFTALKLTNSLLFDKFVGGVVPRGVPEKVQSALALVQDVTSERQLEDLAHEVSNSNFRLSDPLIIFAPCLSRARLKRILGKRYSDRVLSLLFGNWNYDRPIGFEQNSRLSPQERKEVLDLILTANLERSVIYRIIGIFGLVTQTAVLCLPALRSALLNSISQIRRLYYEPKTTSALQALTSLGDQLGEALPPELREVTKTSSALTFVSDLPFEMARIEGRPIHWTTRVSRIPATPVNVTLSVLRHTMGAIEVTKVTAQKVLVVNCLDPSDRLYRLATELHSSLQQASIPHNYYEVSSFEEYEMRVRSVKPLVLVHTGHGTMSAERAAGFLQFRKEIKDMSTTGFNTWMAPIVLLGACDTYSADPAGTAGVAFLRLGARAVLGTMMEIDAVRTVELFEKIIKLLWIYLEPVPQNSRGELRTWGTVVWRAIELARRDDPLSAFYRHQLSVSGINLTQEMADGIANHLEMLFQKGDAKAVGDDLVLTIRKHLEETNPALAQRFGSFCQSKGYWPNSSLYTLLGLPETITVQPSEGWNPVIIKKSF